MSFIDELSKITSQMSNDVDYKHLNTKIKEQYDILLSSINNDHNSIVVVNNTKINPSKAITNACSNDIKNPEECLKCKRKCLSRSVWCSKGNHWIHYHCEKLKSEMINILENIVDTNHYICSLCDIDSIGDKQVSVNSTTETQLCNSDNLLLVNIVNEESFVEGHDIETETLVKQYITHLPTIDKNCDEDQVIPKVTLVQSLLLEEFPRTCALCLQSLNSDEQICEVCDQSYHVQCMGKDNKMCLGCEVCDQSYHIQCMGKDNKMCLGCEVCDQSYHIQCMGKDNKMCLGCEVCDQSYHIQCMGKDNKMCLGCEVCDQSYHVQCMGKDNKMCLGCEATHSQISDNLH
ncbi:unnamed protein product [Mytilus coruscus]|uniref:Zinc finger PHD-type domain-containing protein n=1 Tax=Mytilus coruscus TaxID=42192 RepID=A0A6J8DTT8_MYTCO|nr:unnamed protein product [Mytilus coruscus]